MHDIDTGSGGYIGTGMDTGSGVDIGAWAGAVAAICYRAWTRKLGSMSVWNGV